MHTSAQASQEDRTSVMSKMKRSMTILAGRPISESGMTERSNKVRRNQCVVMSGALCGHCGISSHLVYHTYDLQDLTGKPNSAVAIV